MTSMSVQQAATPKKYSCVLLSQQWQNGTVATVENQTQSWMTLDRYQNWAGIPALGTFPSTIAPNSVTHFTHLRGGHFGSIAAVQYSGLNATGIRCAWLLAWQAPVRNDPPSPPNRVYVACGPKVTIDAMTWDQVIKKLDISPTDDSAIDSATKISVDALIHDLTANAATLIANFKLVP